MNEFEIIDFFFKRPLRRDVALGPGDDCAILSVPQDKRLAISIDTLVSGVHFPPTILADDLGYRSLAVALSDLAAMGAEPAWVTLSLTLPDNDVNWLEKFSQGFFSLADEFSLSLVGGDLTRGPLSITCQVHGFLPDVKGLQREGAQPGDSIYVTGALGSAYLGLKWLMNDETALLEQHPQISQAFLRPTPQIEAGLQLRDCASAAIDISDGLLADLHHILSASGVGAELQLSSIPMNPILSEDLGADEAIKAALGGGDDYQLCFTMAGEPGVSFEYFRIGTICASMGISLLDSCGECQNFDIQGYQHF